MKFQHIRTVDRFLRLEIGYASDIGPAGLSEAIIEALDKGGVLDEARVVYIRAQGDDTLEAVDLWAPKAEAEPPPLPSVEEEDRGQRLGNTE